LFKIINLKSNFLNLLILNFFISGVLGRLAAFCFAKAFEILIFCKNSAMSEVFNYNN
jgi:hypothetical protein